MRKERDQESTDKAREPCTDISIFEDSVESITKMEPCVYSDTCEDSVESIPQLSYKPTYIDLRLLCYVSLDGVSDVVLSDIEDHS